MFVFQYKGPARAKNVNPRAELHGEEKELGIDVNIEAIVSIGVAAQLLFTDTKKADAALKALMFEPDGAINPAIKEISWHRKYEGYILDLTGGRKPIPIRDATLCKFKTAAAGPDTVTLKFQIQFAPSKKAIADITDLILQDVIEVNIEGPAQGDMVDAEAESEEAEAA